MNEEIIKGLEDIIASNGTTCEKLICHKCPITPDNCRYGPKARIQKAKELLANQKKIEKAFPVEILKSIIDSKGINCKAPGRFCTIETCPLKSFCIEGPILRLREARRIYSEQLGLPLLSTTGFDIQAVLEPSKVILLKSSLFILPKIKLKQTY
jgi:hypothetical protein